MSKLKCTSVSKSAWNDETSVFENEDLKVVITVKDPKRHGKVKVGDEMPFELKNPKAPEKAPKAPKAPKGETPTV